MNIFFIVMLLVIGIVIGITGTGSFLYAPLMIFFLGFDIRQAILIALGSYIIIAGGSLLLNRKKRKIHRHILFAQVAAAFPGVFAGQILNFYSSEIALILCFALFLLGMVIIIFFESSGKYKGYSNSVQHNQRHNIIVISAFAGGFLTGFVGIAGVVVTIPVMSYLGYDPKISVTTSSVSAVLYSLLAFTLHSFIIKVSPLLIFSVGFLGLLSSLAASHLQHFIDRGTSRRLICLLMIICIGYLFLYAYNRFLP